MSAIFDRLTQLFEQGHARDVGELMSDSRFADLDRTADAAVLIAVTERPDPTVLLTQRPRTMRDHPGQVAFPGGKLDEGENAVEVVTAACNRALEERIRAHPDQWLWGHRRYRYSPDLEREPYVS